MTNPNSKVKQPAASKNGSSPVEEDTFELAKYEAIAMEILKSVSVGDDPAEIHSWLSTRLATMGGQVEDGSIMTWEESFTYYEDLLRKRMADAKLPPEQRKIFDWPWSSWNQKIEPLSPGMLATIAAGDGIGKTIYAENLCEHWARKGYQVVFIHFELNKSLMMDRRGTRQANIDYHVLNSGHFGENELGQVIEAHKRLKSWPGSISYVHTPGWTIEKTLGALRVLKARGQCDIVMVDYLEKASGSKRQNALYKGSGGKSAREADDVELLKNFGESTETPMVMLNQFSKAGKESSFEEMDRNDIRGAGEKSEKSNLVILLDRKKISSIEDDNTRSRTVNVRVDKQTVGPPHTFKQHMVPERYSVGDEFKGEQNGKR